MPIPSAPSNAPPESGYAFLITILILALLGALGVAGLQIAGLNIVIAVNERDAKAAFFLADSGVNIGRTFLEASLGSANSSFYDDGTNATLWQNKRVFEPGEYPTVWHRSDGSETYVRSGLLRRRLLPGAAIQSGTGYDGTGRSASTDAVSATFLIRAHSLGRRGSSAEIDLAWEHIIR